MTLQALIETGITAEFLASAGWPVLMIFLTGVLFRSVLNAK